MCYSLEWPSVCVCQRRQLAQQSRWTRSHPRSFEAKIHVLANRVLKSQLTLAIYLASLNLNCFYRAGYLHSVHCTVKKAIYRWNSNTFLVTLLVARTVSLENWYCTFKIYIRIGKCIHSLFSGPWAVQCNIGMYLKLSEVFNSVTSVPNSTEIEK